MSNATLLPIQQFTDNAGALLSLGRVYSYQVGTLTPKTLYKSSSGSGGASYTNYFQLDQYGRTTLGIWGTGYYRIIIKSADGATTYWDIDNVSGGEFTPAVSNSSIFTSLVELQSGVNLKMWNTGNTFSGLFVQPNYAANRTYTLPDTNINKFIVNTGNATTQGTQTLGTTNIASLTTAPTTTNSNIITSMVITHTAQKTTNPIRVHGSLCIGTTPTVPAYIALFQAGTLVASKAFTITTTLHNYPFDFYISAGAGTVSSQAYQLYMGSTTMSAQTVYFNSISTTTTWGGTISSTMNLDEYSS